MAGPDAGPPMTDAGTLDAGALDTGALDTGAMDARVDADVGDDPHPGWSAIEDERLGWLQDAVEAARSEFGLPGLAMAAAYANTQEVMVATDGLSNTAEAETWGPERSFRIGSVTKTFTAALILQLADEGVIDLDDSVETWVPGYFDGLGITLRHLITNTSGIPNYNWVDNFDMERAWSPTEILEWVNTRELMFAPGSDYFYSSTNYVLQGLVIEAATGGTYEEALNERLLGPLGLRDTYLADTITPHEHIVRSYDADGLDISERDDPTYGWAAGAIVSTPCDLARWGSELFRGDVLSAEMRELMVTPGVHGRQEYGYGVFVRGDDSSSIYGHEGGFAGFGTYLYHESSSGITLVVMRNQVVDASFNDMAEHAWVPLLGL